MNYRVTVDKLNRSERETLRPLMVTLITATHLRIPQSWQNCPAVPILTE